MPDYIAHGGTTYLQNGSINALAMLSDIYDIYYTQIHTAKYVYTANNNTVLSSKCNMLVKVNRIDATSNKVNVTQLDIDDYGSVIPVKELELNIQSYGDSIIQTLKSSSYAAIFTEGNNTDDSNSTITLASGMTLDELNREKNKTIERVANKKKK
jgi:hypothetical protein